MKKRRFSSTELKRNTAEILNLVAYGRVVAVVEKYGDPIVEISPLASRKKGTNLETKIKKYFGSIPNFPQVSKRRHFRKKKIAL